MRRFFLISSILLAMGCTPELDEEPRCRLTADGWLCDDGASPPDSGTDMGTTPEQDATSPVPDMGTTPEQDMGQPPEPANSCAELKARGDTGRGVRTIELSGNEVDVFCDQDLEGGGWMLLGRSVAGGGGNFGWGSSAGSLNDDNSPYSIGRTDFPISELLIGNRGDGKTWGNRIYRVALPANFLNDCTASPCQTTVTTVTGTCANPTMFNWAGRTQKTDSFWFRDVEGDNPYGFFPNGWSVFYADCVGGELEAQQGMLFAR